MVEGPNLIYWIVGLISCSTWLVSQYNNNTIVEGRSSHDVDFYCLVCSRAISPLLELLYPIDVKWRKTNFQPFLSHWEIPCDGSVYKWAKSVPSSTFTEHLSPCLFESNFSSYRTNSKLFNMCASLLLVANYFLYYRI